MKLFEMYKQSLLNKNRTETFRTDGLCYCRFVSLNNFEKSNSVIGKHPQLVTTLKNRKYSVGKFAYAAKYDAWPRHTDVYLRLYLVKPAQVHKVRNCSQPHYEQASLWQSFNIINA